ncbi:MAG TPA: hypothetical protein VFN36_01675 [Solirubrobacteraceae bacterium]|nr:hypothetical protein [Solirubrobacteraceae bacterium]
MSGPASRRPGQSSRLFHAESERLPASLPIRLLRWWIPAALCVIGVVLLIVDRFDTFGVSAFAAFAGAGSSTWLINWLWRIGVSGDDERDREAQDRAFLASRARWPTGQERAFFTEHGHWPDEAPPGGDEAPRT